MQKSTENTENSIQQENNQSEPEVEDCSSTKQSETLLPSSVPAESQNLKIDKKRTLSKKKRKREEENEFNFMSSAIDKLQDISNRASQVVIKDDSYDHFGRYVASMLRNIGLPTAMRLQQQITCMITKATCPTANLFDTDSSVMEIHEHEPSQNIYSPNEEYQFIHL